MTSIIDASRMLRDDNQADPSQELMDLITFNLQEIEEAIEIADEENELRGPLGMIIWELTRNDLSVLPVEVASKLGDWLARYDQMPRVLLTALHFLQSARHRVPADSVEGRVPADQ